jgi:hypothetical protein
MSPMICYEDKKFGAERLEMIRQANSIIAEYATEGYDLTLRQLYYQFVSRDLIPNRQSEYKRLGSIVSEGRRAGLIDWDAITDRTRNLRSLGSWKSPAAILAEDARVFRFDRWETQDNYVEVWFEKDALMGVFERVAHELRLPFFSCRGYTSDSEVWGAAQRLADKTSDGKQVIVLHFGDHDPSGIDMTRDIRDRLELFGAADVEVRRLALNMPQVRAYKPPPNPAKESDSRFIGYREKFGDESWELDALEPTVLAALVRDEVMSLVDEDVWADEIAREKKARAELRAISDNYVKIAKKLNVGGEP